MKISQTFLYPFCNYFLNAVDIFGPTGKQLKPRENTDGYAVVTMGNKRIRRSTQFVHRVVAALFLSNPQNLSDVDHLDGNRMNTDKSSLLYWFNKI